MILKDLAVASPTGGRGPTDPHRDAILGDITGFDPMDENQAQQVLEIGRDPEGTVEKPTTQIDGPPAIKRGMRRHKPEPHHPGPEETGGIIAHTMVQPLRLHEMDVAIDGVRPRSLQSLRQPLEHPVRGIKVVRVQDADHIPRRHGDPLVHRVVNTPVRLTDPAHPPPETGFILPDKSDRVVFRRAIDHDILNILIRLPKDTLEGVTKSRAAIIGSGDNRYFHK